MGKKEIIDAAHKSILEANEDIAMELIDEAVDLKLNLLELLKFGFNAGNKEVANLFEKGEVSIPELIMSTETMKNATLKIENLINASHTKTKGKIVIATVEGDIHDIGKGIVITNIKAAGIDIIDLGRDIPIDTIIEKAEEHDADIIATSALLTTTLTEQKKLEEKLRKLGLREKYITMVGGAPCTRHWAKKIGADIYCENAAEAVREAIELLK
jgi:trimethylamine corrinoid protein